MIDSTYNHHQRESSYPAIGSLSAQALEHLIYIVGSARGGTTALRRALDIHDRILVLPNMTHFMNQLWRYRKKIHERLLHQILRLPRFYRETEVFSALEKERRVVLQNYIRDALRSGNLKLMWQIYPVVYGIDQENPKNPRTILAWADKANDFYGIEAVANSFPKGKFIFITRDPRGAVSSLAKRMVLKENFSTHGPIQDAKVVEACVHWRWMTQRALYFAKRHPERSLLIRLEDLLSSPKQILNNVFSFCLGITLTEETIVDRLKDLRYTISDGGFLGKGLSREPIDRWKGFLSERQEKIIKRLTGSIASKVGYALGEDRDPGGEIFGILRQLPGLKRRTVMMAKIIYLKAFETVI